jgi:transposase
MIKNTKKIVNNTQANESLQAINERVAGIDIGSRSIFVCAAIGGGRTEVRQFSTFTPDLQAMCKWLRECKIISAAMESTGVYWIPVYDLLEQGGFEVLLVNAHYLKTVPGRKTDVKDCQWIQRLHSYGLLAGSFRPSGECLTLRTYVRQRTKLFQLAGSQVNLMHKALTQMNLQLTQVLSDIIGDTGLKIMRAITSGIHNPQELARLRNNQCKKSVTEIAQALTGNFRAELVFSLKQALDSYDFIHNQIVECEAEIQKIVASWQSKQSEAKELPDRLPTTTHQKKTNSNRSPYSFDIAAEIARITGVQLTDVPGLEANTIVRIISEIGTDLSRWPTAKHFASWLGLCPGNKISGSKVLSSKTKPTANKAAQAFRFAAQALHGSKSALGAFFRKMRSRLGSPQAVTAAAHKLARIVYHLLKHQVPFQNTQQAEYEQLYQKRRIASLQRQAAEMGYTLTPATISQ